MKPWQSIDWGDGKQESNKEDCVFVRELAGIVLSIATCTLQRKTVGPSQATNNNQKRDARNTMKMLQSSLSFFEKIKN